MTSDSETGADGDRIVVGVDGSLDPRQAVEWSITHAGPTDTIDMADTWQQPIMAGEAGMAAVIARELHLLRFRP